MNVILEPKPEPSSSLSKRLQRQISLELRPPVPQVHALSATRFASLGWAIFWVGTMGAYTGFAGDVEQAAKVLVNVQGTPTLPAGTNYLEFLASFLSLLLAALFLYFLRFRLKLPDLSLVSPRDRIRAYYMALKALMRGGLATESRTSKVDLQIGVLVHLTILVIVGLVATIILAGFSYESRLRSLQHQSANQLTSARVEIERLQTQANTQARDIERVALLLQQTLGEQHSYASAIGVLTLLSETSPSKHVHLALARLHWAVDDYDRAIASANMVLSTEPTNALALIIRGDCLRAHSNRANAHVSALRDLQSAASLSSIGSEAWVRAMGSIALVNFDQALLPENKPRRAELLSLTISNVQTALKFSGGFVDQVFVGKVYNIAATAMHQNEDFDSAEEYFRKAYEIKRRHAADSAFGNFLNNYGRFQMEKGELDRAESLLIKAIDDHFLPSNNHLGLGSAHANLGRVLLKRGDLRAARTISEIALKELELNGGAQTSVDYVKRQLQKIAKASQLSDTPLAPEPGLSRTNASVSMPLIDDAPVPVSAGKGASR